MSYKVVVSTKLFLNFSVRFLVIVLDRLNENRDCHVYSINDY